MKFPQVLVPVLMLVVQPTAAAGQPPTNPQPPRIIAEFGVASGDPAQEIGNIADVVRGPNRSIILLDDRLNRIWVLDSNGKFQRTFGRSGAGPGEFRNPIAMAVDPSTQFLYVLDQGLARVSIVGLADGDLRLKATFQVTPYAVDICALQGQLVIYSPGGDDRPVLQVTDSVGAPIHLFGQAFGQKLGPNGQMAMRGALVECLASSQTIVLVSQLEPEIRAFSPAGKLLWTRSMSGFLPVKINLLENGFRVDTTSVGPADYTDQVFVLNDSTLVVQSQRKTPPWAPRSLQKPTSRVSRFLAAADGATNSTTDALPRIAWVDNGRIIAIQNDPFPKLTIYRNEGSTFVKQ